MSNDNKSGLRPANQAQDNEPAADSRIAELERQLAAQTERADAAVARSQAIESAGSDRAGYTEKQVKPAASKAKQHWRFEVRCTAKPSGHPDIAPEAISAVDESEAIRMFCLMRKDEKGRQLDPTRYQFQALCLDQKQRDQLRLNRINNRRALELGRLPLTLNREESFRPVEENVRRQERELANAGGVSAKR